MTFDDGLLAENPQAPGLIVISGTFNGNIYNGSIVYVTSNGSFKGNIITKNLIIAGKVTGSVQVENLKICDSGKLFFDKIQYDNLCIEEGGLLIEAPGNVEVKSPSARFNVSIPISKETGKKETIGSDELLHFDCSY
ncbi:MAG: polymer-forming cytoskeletal protein [Tepidanaerobacteraceae bacterium]|mgnify:FL=1|jgi:cytoskeletal protein CcmA (bactofilin family)|nr:polymer-forming cytoskeletal protein [Tepidanaerobacter sp.]HQA59846.1 polymer-forming cytoskeletal protein [Tepidanaerobacteraceae bacterium]HQE06452.1 polymer-forming cytoskeletal protein [Tepidanaerobacteraceae bacterium]